MSYWTLYRLSPSRAATETKSSPKEILGKLEKSNINGEWWDSRPKTRPHWGGRQKWQNPNTLVDSIFCGIYISGNALFGRFRQTLLVGRIVWRIYSFQYGLLRELFGFIISQLLRIFMLHCFSMVPGRSLVLWFSLIATAILLIQQNRTQKSINCHEICYSRRDSPSSIWRLLRIWNAWSIFVIVDGNGCSSSVANTIFVPSSHSLKSFSRTVWMYDKLFSFSWPKFSAYVSDWTINSDASVKCRWQPYTPTTHDVYATFMDNWDTNTIPAMKV